ncbi:MAG: hypothetical protein LBG17_04730 [Bacteroidales bacterium]|jgi:hypothetical protein|nr:hypothetical protein [Bacteroidales bacterium]
MNETLLNRAAINGVDCYERFRLFFLKGAYREWLRFGSAKKVDSNEWWEYDGVWIDTSTPVVLESTELSLPAALHGDIDMLNEFILYMRSRVYHHISVTLIPGSVLMQECFSSRMVRIKEIDNIKVFSGLIKFTLIIADDTPYRGYTTTITTQTDSPLSIDGVGVASYGLMPIGDWRNQLSTPIEIRENSIADLLGVNGLVYGVSTHGGRATSKTNKEASLIFWLDKNLSKNYNDKTGGNRKAQRLFEKFFNVLLQAGERNLSFTWQGIKMGAYCRYKDMNIIDCGADGYNKMKFSVTFDVLRVDYLNEWILRTGRWNDNGFWIDDQQWRDYLTI